MSSWSRVLKSLAVQYFGRIIGLAASLVTTILLTRALGVYGYGQFTTVFAIANLIIAFSDLGFFWSTIQHVKGGDPRQVASEISGVRLAITIFVTIVSLALVWVSHYPLIIKECFAVLSIFIISSALDNVMIAVHQSSYSMGWPTFSNLLSRVIILILVAIGFYQHWTLFWLVTANGTVTVVNLLIDWYILVRRYGLILPKWFGFTWSKYYRSVVMLGAVTIVNALYLQVDTIILSALRSPVDVGIYGAAQKIVTIITIFQGMFLANFFPFLLEQSKLDTKKFQQAISNALVILMVIGLPLGLLIISIPTELVRIVAGRQFISTSTISFDSIAISTPITLAILGFYVLVNYFDGIFTNSLIALDRLKWLLGVNIVALIFNIVLNLIFDRTYSYFAAAILTVATELIIALTAIFKLKSINHIVLPWGKIGLIALSSLLAITVMLIQPLRNVFADVIIFGVVYIIFIALFMRDERGQLISFLNKAKT